MYVAAAEGAQQHPPQLVKTKMTDAERKQMVARVVRILNATVERLRPIAPPGSLPRLQNGL